LALAEANETKSSESDTTVSTRCKARILQVIATACCTNRPECEMTLHKHFCVFIFRVKATFYLRDSFI